LATNEQPDGILLDLVRYALNIATIVGGVVLVAVLLFILVDRAHPVPETQEEGEQAVQAQEAPASTAPAPTEASAPAAATEPPPPAAEPDPKLIALGEEVFRGPGGCTACHTIEGVEGAVGAVGPALTHIGVTAEERAKAAGVADAAAYIRQSIVEPNAYVVPECPTGACVAGMMPATLAQTLTEEQINGLVQFLLSLKGGG
jgi:mono/diheme cytochrome c family protein